MDHTCQHDQRIVGFIITLNKWLILLTLPSLLGCAAVALTGTGLGVSYTLTNVAYRSFNSPIDQVHEATISVLRGMDIKIIAESKSEDSRTIKATTPKLNISIDLEKITSKTTQIKVDARKNVVLKDKATAAEIIAQVGKTLED